MNLITLANSSNNFIKLFVKKSKIFALVLIAIIFTNQATAQSYSPTAFSGNGKQPGMYNSTLRFNDNFKLPPDSTVKDTTAKKTTGQKMENLFKYIPVPLYSYSSEGGNLFGLAKFNAFQLSKKDTIAEPSIASGVFSVTSKGRINASLATQLVFNENKFILLSFLNYKKQPEYLLPIGNTIYRDSEGNVDSLEQITYERFRFVAQGLYLVAKNLYVGGALDYANYIDIKTDTNSFLVRDGAIGLEGGTDFGIGLSAAFDNRDSRYTPTTGGYILTYVTFNPKFLGSDYQFTKFSFDARKFYNPWLKHVIALQATTSYSDGDVPFYDLSLLGSDNKMRGYYQGALRDKVLVDGQVEYRMPVWKMFGVTGWFGAGRTAPDYEGLSFDDYHLNYGVGFRVRVDTKNNINMRVDFGFGPHGITGTYINFAEAF